MNELAQLETLDRNRQLMENHKRLPSYCLWRQNDIEMESIEQRMLWWKNVSKESKDKTLCIVWIKLLIMLKKNLSEN